MAMVEIKKTSFNNYNWKGLTLGALIAIRYGLKLHNTILAREIVQWLDANCPEVKTETEKEDL